MGKRPGGWVQPGHPGTLISRGDLARAWNRDNHMERASAPYGPPRYIGDALHARRPAAPARQPTLCGVEPVYGLPCQEKIRVALRSFFLFLGRLHGFMLPSGSILTGLRSARTNSNGGTRRAAVVRSVSAPNRYHGSALARSVRRWAAKTAASRKTVDRLLGGSRRAQEIHPFPRVRQFKTYGSFDKSNVQLIAGSAEEQSRASQSFLSVLCWVNPGRSCTSNPSV
jgi:hypothetical protein